MSTTPVTTHRARPFVVARPANKAEQPTERQEERGFTRDSFESARARMPRAIESAIPYLHGATVGHEGLHIGSASHAAEEVIECGAGLAGEAEGLLGATLGIAAAAKTSAAVGGLLSLAFHGYRMVRGKESVATGGTAVVADVASAAIGGAAGAACATLGASALGIACGPFAIVGMALGMAGYLGAEYVLHHTSAYRRFVGGVYHLLGGKGEFELE